jgi:hypothetical protein
VVFGKFNKKRSGKEAMSPVVSTVIMTGAMIAILSVALVFANNLLWSRVAEGDFDSSRQLMQSVGLQIDEVAWTMGRTQTIRYASQHGDIEFRSDVLNYTIDVTVGGEVYSYNYSTGALMFNIPTSRYSISDDYWAKIFPETDENLTLKGTSAPVARVFAVEKTPMPDGKYIRVVVAPSIRVLYSNITTSGNPTYYVKMYLPVLNVSESPRLSQSITLAGESLNAYTRNGVDSIDVTVSFPKEGYGFNSDFFKFPGANPENFDFTGYGNVVLELYVSEVSVAFGVS